jgi:hypothetical protein
MCWLIAASVSGFALFGTAVWARIRQDGGNPLLAGLAIIGVALVAITTLDTAGTFALLGRIGGQHATAPAALQAWHLIASSGSVSAVLSLASRPRRTHISGDGCTRPRDEPVHLRWAAAGDGPRLAAGRRSVPRRWPDDGYSRKSHRWSRFATLSPVADLPDPPALVAALDVASSGQQAQAAQRGVQVHPGQHRDGGRPAS